MRFKYRRILCVILGVQTVIIWCYMVTRTGDTLGEHTVLKLDILNKYNRPEKLSNMINNNQSDPETAKAFLKELTVTNGDCVGMEFPANLMEEETWSAIDEAKNAYVFSAYVVNQSGKIKVVGASALRTLNILCQYWFVMRGNDSVEMHVKSPILQILPESHGNKYSGALYICPALNTIPDYISLVTSKCRNPLHLLKVKNGVTPQKYQRKFTVCLKPLHFRYGRAYELVEWIEFNKILGADMIIIYNYSIAMNTDQVLDHYEKLGIVEIVQWNLPIKSYTWPKRSDPVEIHSIGMLPMLQDCFLRSRSYSEFVINADVDEFIIPRSDNVTTWLDMMSMLPGKYDTYIFRNTFFRKEWNNSIIHFRNKAIAQKLNIVSLQNFEREDKILPPRLRSKYFTRTLKEDKGLMIHEVSISPSHVVPVEIGILHHYRNWQKYKDTSRRIVDKTVLTKFGEKLIERVEKRWEKLGNVKLDIPI